MIENWFIMSNSDSTIHYVAGAAIFGGGLMGYMKKSSRPSLIAGAVVGGTYAGAA